MAKRFTAGLLRHAHEITAVTNQWVNSYKRLVAGYEAPIHVSWARNNRSALVRVPVVKRNKIESTRVEYRAPDSACNPYLAFAVILAAGLKGIEEGYELPREAATNLFAMTPEELAADGIRSLPGSLNEAVVEMEHSELVAETLGRARLRVVHPQQAGRVGRVQDPHQPVRARPLLPAPLGGVARWCPRGDTTADGTAAVLPRPVPHRARPGPRAGRLPVEGRGPARARRDRRARRRLGRGRGVRRDRRHRRLRPVPAGAGPGRPAAAPAARGGTDARSTTCSCARTTSTTSVVLPAQARGGGAPASPISSGAPAGGFAPELIEHGPLVLNLETYQAAVAGRVLDLTYMEYELLRFLAARPGKVFTRETLLSRVWGYEYYGGARTVDVHVRRLRAKLGEEHAHLIETVRSVGLPLRPRHLGAVTASTRAGSSRSTPP